MTCSHCIATVGLAGLLLATGCATVPYPAGRQIENEKTYRLPAGEPQIVRGHPNRFLDACDWIWPGSLLSKLILWNKRMDSHQISDETEAILREYLEENELHSVKVRLNAYSVKDEWRRLARNKAVGAGWRYTLGGFSLVMYTALPGRFFGGDHFNPYTNTINIYSDIKAVAVHEAGHAKDLARRKYKGGYSALYALPLVPLYHEAQASNDAVSYLRAKGTVKEQKEGYHVLYPAYGTYVGGSFAQYFPPYNTIIYLAGVIPGHIVGRIKGARVKEPPPAEVPQSANGWKTDPDNVGY